MGVEQEFPRSYPAAILSYKKAVNFAEKNLGPDDGITQNLRSVYENAKNEVSSLNNLDKRIKMKLMNRNYGAEKAQIDCSRRWLVVITLFY